MPETATGEEDSSAAASAGEIPTTLDVIISSEGISTIDFFDRLKGEELKWTFEPRKTTKDDSSRNIKLPSNNFLEQGEFFPVAIEIESEAQEEKEESGDCKWLRENNLLMFGGF